RATLSRVLNGSSGISADMALRLRAALGTSPEMWMGLQDDYELWQAAKGKRPKIEPLRLAA
ncbi:MAG: HigA family addiction module antitoxin, partial [Gallionella sp.]